MVRLRIGNFVRFVFVPAIVFLHMTIASAQWDPWQGLWEKSHELDLRIMTWNVGDGICSTNFKTEAFNNWTALAVIIAALKPDILLIQEAGDNSGNGTGIEGDNVDDLLITLELFFHGGLDPFHNHMPVTAYVRKYAPHYDLPHLFVSEETDGYNRNVILSRFPFFDLNGDSKSLLSDIPFLLPHAYAPGGTGGVRGFQFAEISLPHWIYPGDLVVGNGHLKAGNEPEEMEARLRAGQNVAYFIDHLYNGAGMGIPDPYDKILDNPAAQTILEEGTPVIIGGDWNEDEYVNGRDGP
ncbi:MAG: endonuclease/exonuclease/phosphatase family protein, partial [Planctomycetota bacterium]